VIKFFNCGFHVWFEREGGWHLALKLLLDGVLVDERKGVARGWGFEGRRGWRGVVSV